jgi:hypothetical protein
MSILGVTFVFVEGSLAMEAEDLVFVADASGARDVEWTGQIIEASGPTSNERLASLTHSWIRVSHYSDG